MKSKKSEKVKSNVVIIGIGGPSGSGKTSISKLLIDELNCPFKVFHCDTYFKLNLPKDKKYGSNWEIPDAIDFDSIKKNLKILKNHLEKSPNEKFKSLLKSERDQNIDPVNADYKTSKSKPYYIIIEGFLLFSDSELCSMIDYHFFINSSQEVCRERRMKRQKKMTQEQYDEMVWKHFLDYKDIQLKNSNPVELDGEDELEKNVKIIIQTLKH